MGERAGCKRIINKDGPIPNEAIKSPDVMVLFNRWAHEART